MCDSLFPTLNFKGVTSRQYFYRYGMSQGKETFCHPIRKSIKYCGQCTRSDKINGNSRKINKEQTLCISYWPLQHVGKVDLNLKFC